MGYRYIGAKTQVIGEVLHNLKKIVEPGATVVDLMCGTGAVSSALRQEGYRVIANDLMTYSFHHAKVALLFTSLPTFKGCTDFWQATNHNHRRTLFDESPYAQMLDAISSLRPVEGYFWKEFSSEGSPLNGNPPRNYFTPPNAKKIDAARTCIRELSQRGLITPLEHSLLIHDLIMATNDVANIAGTYGHYLSKTVTRAIVPICFKPSRILVRNDQGWHRVHHQPAESAAASISADVCYIDPPYMKRQYAANYHILETLAREDEPEAIGVSGLRPWRDQYSNFCTKTKIRDSFREVFTRMRCGKFLISYSEDGLLGVSELKKLFGEFGEVKVSTFENKRFRSNNSPLTPRLTEYLFFLKRS